MARKKKQHKKETNAVCTAVAKELWFAQGGSDDSRGHGQGADFHCTNAYGEIDFGGLPGNNGVSQCYWHQTGPSRPNAENIYGQFICGSDNRLYCRVHSTWIHGDVVLYGDGAPYTYEYRIRGGEKGSWGWPDYPSNPDAYEILTYQFTPTVTNVVDVSNNYQRTKWTKNDIGRTISSADGWRDIGPITDYINQRGTTTDIGHAYLGACGRYETQSGIHPITRHLYFSAEHIPLEYYPCKMYNPSSGKFVSCNDAGHKFTLCPSDSGSFRDVKNQEGGPSSSDKAFMAQGSSASFAKIIKSRTV